MYRNINKDERLPLMWPEKQAKWLNRHQNVVLIENIDKIPIVVLFDEFEIDFM